MSVVALSFLSFLAAITLLGAASVFRSKKTTDDYLLASRSVGPGLTALSSVATNNSGYMFVGLVGFAYASGLAAMWLQVGWILGDMVAWAWLHRRVREESGRHETATLPALLGTSRHGRRQRSVTVASALLTLVLLAAYAAAQLNAGSKALNVLFGWDYAVGAVIGAAIVVVYCFAGGIRASIWTDAAQSVVMFLSLAALCTVALVEAGGPAALFARLQSIDPALVTLFPEQRLFGFAPWFLGFIFGGFGVIGQPHILVRTMALRSASLIPQARRIYFLWFIPFSAFSVLVGLSARALLPEAGTGAFDPELALPQLGMSLLAPVAVGFLLAGLFSATMSTADSQILACSAALTHDLAPRLGRSYLMTKLGTLLIAGGALAIALVGPDSVFLLVLMAWSALAVSLGPVLLLRLLRWPLGPRLAIAVMAAGLVGAIGWKYGLELDGAVYEILPGLVTAFAVYAFAYRMGWDLEDGPPEGAHAPDEAAAKAPGLEVG